MTSKAFKQKYIEVGVVIPKDVNPSGGAGGDDAIFNEAIQLPNKQELAKVQDEHSDTFLISDESLERFKKNPVILGGFDAKKEKAINRQISK